MTHFTPYYPTKTSLRRVENRILRPVLLEEDERLLRRVSKEQEQSFLDLGARDHIGISGIVVIVIVV